MDENELEQKLVAPEMELPSEESLKCPCEKMWSLSRESRFVLPPDIPRNITLPIIMWGNLWQSGKR
jgi:hypothetical protein